MCALAVCIRHIIVFTFEFTTVCAYTFCCRSFALLSTLFEMKMKIKIKIIYIHKDFVGIVNRNLWRACVCVFLFRSYNSSNEMEKEESNSSTLTQRGKTNDVFS